MRRIRIVVEPSRDNNDEQINAQFRHIKELSLLKYESEDKREQNLIQQSSQMQTAFSFVSAAVFMAIPVCVEYRGALSLKFFLVSTSIVVAFLIASLVLASLAQWRYITETFPDVDKIKESVINSDEWQKLCIEYHQINQWIELVGKVQKEKARLNDKRVKFIMASMICFYASIAAIVICFLIAIINLI